jgi:hypothetical protein
MEACVPLFAGMTESTGGDRSRIVLLESCYKHRAMEQETTVPVELRLPHSL